MMLRQIERQDGRGVIRRAAFTLMEMLVVVAILVVLAGVGGYEYMKHLDETKISAAKLQSKNIAQAAEAYSVKNGSFPQSLAVLCERDADGTRPYLDQSAIIDPWGHQYNYDMSGPNNQGAKPDVWATSPQGQQIGNWMR